jgi:predicted Rossmann-fold nucleotide-binding protein
MSTAVTVFCGSSLGRGDRFVAVAAELGEELARRGVELVYGGGGVGLLTELVVTGSMHKRKARMIAGSSGFVVLPGGFGTFEEALEVVTWNQLGLISANVVCLDVDGFFAPLLDFVRRAVEDGFVRPEHADLLRVAQTAAEAVDLALAPSAPHVPKWGDR